MVVHLADPREKTLHVDRGGMIPLYPHQLDFNARSRAVAARGVKYILMQAATGFGKSVCATAQIKSAQDKGFTSLFVVPKRDLVRQMSAQFTACGISHSFIAAGYNFNPYATAFIATHGSLINRLGACTPSVVFCDETHNGGKTLDTIINYYKSQGAYIIGLSATPQRLDGIGLSCWYEEMVCSESVAWLIEKGFLSSYKYFAPNTPDLSGIKKSGGDYAPTQLNDFMMRDNVIIGDAAEHYKKHAFGKLGIGFATSIAHAQKIAAAFNAAGIPSASIDGQMGDAERRMLIRKFAMREILYLISVDLLHTGFDLASNSGMDVTVECMSDLRPTMSLALQSQKWGRVLRRKDYPAIIFDHAANFRTHGFPDTPREWTLESREQGKRASSERSMPVAQCKQCFFAFRPAPVCPNCGSAVVVKSREIESVAGELHEMTKEERAAMKQREVRDRKREQAMAKTLPDLIALGQARGMKNPKFWALNVLKARGR